MKSCVAHFFCGVGCSFNYRTLAAATSAGRSLIVFLGVLFLFGCSENDVYFNVDAGSNKEVAAGDTVQLVATASSSRGEVVTYEWLEMSQHGIAIIQSNEALASFIAPDDEVEITIRLTVTDDQDRSASDDVVISVVAPNSERDPDVPGDDVSGEEIGESEIAKQCAMQSAHCGVILDKEGRSINCGEPLEGEFCVDHRSEPLCELEQLDDGSFDSLFAYIPLQYTDQDLSSNNLPLKISRSPVEVREPFPFISRTDLRGKQVEIDLQEKSLDSARTLSFKFIPDANNQKNTIFSSTSMKVEQQNATITAIFEKPDGFVEIDNDEAELKNHSCNHFAVVLDDNEISSWLNGKQRALTENTDSLARLDGSINVGPYPGRVWDIRIFDRALADDEIEELGEDCAEDLTMASPYEDAPVYMCGVYRCFWWEEGVTDTTQASFEHQVESHNMTWEHNVLASVIYQEGKFCESSPSFKKHLHLSEGYRKSWVSKYNFDRTVGNYWLHENYHAYQSHANNRTGKWYTEASANWAAYSMKPGTDSNELLAFYTLQPHQPLYAREIIPDEWTAFSEYSNGHMYGAGLFIYYLSANYLGPKVSGDVYRYLLSGKASTPTEALSLLLQEAGLDMRDIFGEFAAKTIIWDYPYGEGFKKAEDDSRNRMRSVWNNNDQAWPEADIDNKITAEYDTQGTGGEWVAVPERYMPAPWAYNAYQVNVSAQTSYRVGLRTSVDNPESAEFRATVLLVNEASGTRSYHTLPETAAGEPSSIVVEAQPGDTLYLVVATTPSEDFRSYTMYRYSYVFEAIDGDDGGNGDNSGDGDGSGNGGNPSGDDGSGNGGNSDGGDGSGNGGNSGDDEGSVGDAGGSDGDNNGGADGGDNGSGGSVDTPVSNNKAKVFLMAGQSNMTGYGKRANLPFIDSRLDSTRDDVFVQSIIEPNAAFGPLKVGYGKGADNYGVELKLGQVLGDALEQQIYLFKAAKGGTALDEPSEWRPAAHGGETGNLYAQMLAGFQDFQQQHLADVDYEIAGFIWFQGWNDAVAARAPNYEEHIRNLLSSVRADLGRVDLPVVIVQMNDGRGEHSAQVMAAQAKVAGESELNSLVYTADQRPYFHYGSSSYVVIGERIAQAVLPILGLPASLDENYQVAPGGELKVNATTGVLANDSGENLVATLIGDASHGSVTLESDGSFTYQPNANFQGQDRFTYQAQVGGRSGNPAEVTLWVRNESNPLVLHYDFDSESLAGSSDSISGFPLRQVKEGVTFGEAGFSGNALRFNGSGVLHYMEDYPLPDALNLTTDRDFSITLWIKPDPDQEGEQVLVSNKYYANRDYGFSFGTDSTGTGVSAYLGSYDHSTFSVKSKRLEAANAALDDGNWHHVAMSASFSTGSLTLYVDGNAVAQTDISELSGEINRYESAIGNGAVGGGGNGYVGLMDDLRIYQTALTPAILQEIMSQ